MLGLSFGKLLVLALLVLAIWYGFKYAGRMEQVRQAVKRARAAAEQKRSGGPPRLQAEDMVKCRICGTYVAAHGVGKCGQPDCPW
jgi:ribosomal protein L32